MSVRVTVDTDLCIGNGDCVRIAPKAFRLDNERGVSVVLPGAGSVDRATLDEAAFNCPTRAITVTEAE